MALEADHVAQRDLVVLDDGVPHGDQQTLGEAVDLGEARDGRDEIVDEGVVPLQLGAGVVAPEAGVLVQRQEDLCDHVGVILQELRGDVEELVEGPDVESLSQPVGQLHQGLVCREARVGLASFGVGESLPRS